MAWSDKVIETHPRTFYYTDSRGHQAKVDLGNCPACEKGLPVTEMVSITTMGWNGPRVMSVSKATYERMKAAAEMLVFINNQRERARRFRYSRMIYKGAHHGTR